MGSSRDWRYVIDGIDNKPMLKDLIKRASAFLAARGSPVVDPNMPKLLAVHGVAARFRTKFERKPSACRLTYFDGISGDAWSIRLHGGARRFARARSGSARVRGGRRRALLRTLRCRAEQPLKTRPIFVFGFLFFLKPFWFFFP